MEQSDYLTQLELVEVIEQYKIDKDIPVLIRNLLACMSNMDTITVKREVKKVTGLNVYKYAGSSWVEYAEWYLYSDIQAILMSLDIPEETCKKELSYATIYQSGHSTVDNQMAVVTKYFTVNHKQQLMIKTNFKLDCDVNRRFMCRRVNHNLQVVSERIVKEDLMEQEANNDGNN